MIDVGQHLVVGVSMDRRHDAVLQANRLVQRLDQRRQAVRRAGRVGDYGIVRGQRVVVYAVDDRLVDALAARRRGPWPGPVSVSDDLA